ncbi:hypothetical protein [Streptomyces sp. BA2]|uniref:hypothetical protein n=1 Tax=Streptomyces sp. BA2 TaxID=436595 RepID=UPI0013258700|nr:hypothetical protein [Streptomyces sp. BA2]MWA12965.1 hypothetical protein [Streptomyces sp. BA2]
MIWIYCEDWNTLTEEPMEPLKPKEAQARHSSGELYTAVAYPSEGSAPELRVHIRLETGYAAVVFMDGYGRTSLEYTFTVIDGSLFLETVTSYEYGNSVERGGYADSERMESYDFTPDGIVVQEIEIGDEVSSESRRNIDMTSNWEPIPQFGAYDSLIRRER